MLEFVFRRQGRLSWLFVCIVAVALILGLTDCAGPPERTRAQHLIADGPVAKYDSHLISVRKKAFSLGAGPPSQAWQIEAGAEMTRVDEDGTWLLGLQTPTVIFRPVEFDASEVHAASVEINGLDKAVVKLCWSGPGQQFSHSRCATDRPSRGHATFDLAGNPLWRGPIVRWTLHLMPRETASRLRVGALQAWVDEVQEEKLAGVLQQAWRLTLDSDTYRDSRSALLSPPGLPVNRVVEVPQGGRLEFGYGLPEGVTRPIEFRVYAASSEVAPAEGAVSESDRRLLWQMEVDPATEGASGWHSAQVDLASLAGQKIRLEFETEARETLDLARGIPAWAQPKILGLEKAAIRPNVILVSVDTLRADHLSLYGYPRDTSPNLDAWAGSCATTFENTVAPAPWTLPSHTSMFTGLDALSHGVNHEGAVPLELETLSDVFRNDGYTTIAFTGGGYLSPNYGLQQGFDQFEAWSSLAESEAEAATGVDRALDWLKGRTDRDDGPYFLFLHTYGTHTPFRPRMPYLPQFLEGTAEAGANPESVKPIGTRLTDFGKSSGFQLKLEWLWLEDPKLKRQGTPLAADEMEWPKHLYDAGIGHVDAQLGRFFAGLEALGELDHTIVVVTSDHGESLGENGVVGHTHLYDTALRVPLVIRTPNCRAPARVANQVRTIDIAPTILDYVELGFGTEVDGRTLRPLLEGSGADEPRVAWSYASLANYGISLRLRNQVKYMLNTSAWRPIYGDEQLYQLESDPGELENLAASDRLTDTLRRQVVERLATATDAVRISFRNRGQRAFDGSVQPQNWGAKPHSRVTSWNLPPKRVAISSGTMKFRVEPGDAYDVLLEVPRQRSLTIRVTNRSGEEMVRTIDLSADGSLVLSEAEGLWGDAGSPEGAEDSEIAFRWTYRAASADDSSDTPDEELIQQLRALGYV